MSFLLIAAAVVATSPVRDPFWPVGYEGVRRVISAEPRFVSEEPSVVADKDSSKAVPDKKTSMVATSADPAEEWARRAEEARLRLEMDRRWSAAVKELRFGGVVKMQKGISAVLINGRAHAESDYVRLDHEGYRFIWKVARSATERQLKLDRVKAVGLDEIKGKK